MRIIRLDNQNKIVEVKTVKPNYVLRENEQVSNKGELGQIIQEDGTFIDAPIEPVDQIPTLNEITEETLLETKYQTALLEMMI